MFVFFYSSASLAVLARLLGTSGFAFKRAKIRGRRVFVGRSTNWGGSSVGSIDLKINEDRVLGYVVELNSAQLRVIERREGALLNPPKYCLVKVQLEVECQHLSGVFQEGVAHTFLNVDQTFDPVTKKPLCQVE